MSEDKPITIEPHQHHVVIKLGGDTLAETDRSLLLIESYAPDIYIPFEDIRMQRMTPSDMKTHCIHKGDATYWTVKAGETEADNAMWSYKSPLPGCSAIAGHAAFDFNKVDTYIDDKLVRGHVRDPHKTITTERLRGHLLIEHSSEMVAETDDCVLLYETGLPVRYYIPPSDVTQEFLVASPRKSVCTYKGEAIYYHVVVNEQLVENAVWSYPDPWLDFSPGVRDIAGLLAFYTTAFDRVLINGETIEADEATWATDAQMISKPTIDRTLAAKLESE